MSNIIYLTSTSDIKKDVVSQVFPDHTIISIKNTDITRPEQPIGTHEGVFCAKSRIPFQTYDAPIVSIENYINDGADMVCVIIKYPDGNIQCKIGGKRPITYSQYKTYDRSKHGTFGEYISSIYKGLDPKNWFGDRHEQILSVFYGIQHADITSDTIGAYLDYTADFPKPGVIFQDMSPLFNKHNIELFMRFIDDSIDDSYIFEHVVGLESRGFHIGAMIAKEWGHSFHMARKPGKLPPPTIKVEYGTEYSNDAMEMRVQKLPKGNVLIVDDLIATGNFAPIKNIVVPILIRIKKNTATAGPP